MDLQRPKHSPPIEVELFLDNVGDQISNIVVKEVSKQIEEMFDDCSPRLALPMVWGAESDGKGGPGVKDPLTIDVHMPFDEDATSFWRISLFDWVKQELDFETCGYLTENMTEHAAALRTALSARLRELADLIDAYKPTD